MVKIAERLGQKLFYRIEDVPGISAQTAKG
jgi:hypothetical protein